MTEVPSETLRVAIVGSGPAGLFAAEALAERAEPPIEIEIIESSLTPFGLVRHGVAPDHPAIRSVRRRLEKILERPNVTLLAGVEVGRHVTVEELRARSHAVLYAHGASVDRGLGIPGENLAGVFGATRLVNWYCGKPAAEQSGIEDVLRRATSAVVVGAGNVALDAVRFLAKGRADLEHTDVPQHVLEERGKSKLREVHLVSRRGAAHTRFSTKELRELGELPGVAVVVSSESLESDQTVASEVSATAKRNVELLRSWAKAPVSDTTERRVVLHFHESPTRVVGEHVATGLEVRSSTVALDGRVIPDGRVRLIPADLIVTCVGFTGTPLPGVPFDAEHGITPNVEGRVLRDGRPSVGEYTAGWIKRGPSGVIGANKLDARETVEALLADTPELLAAPLRSGGGISDLIGRRGLNSVDLAGWTRIDAAEIALGSSRGRDRTVIHEYSTLRAVAAGD